MHFLFEVHVNPGHRAEDYADTWMRVSELIQASPGARGTRLHRKVGEPDVLLAIASWASKADRDVMEARIGEEVRRIVAREASFVDIRVIGEFEDPEWVVLPPAEGDGQ